MSTANNKKLTIIGVGRLGLCMALVCENAGYHVVGIDVIPSYVESINNKTLQSYEPNVEQYLKVSKNFVATTSIDEGLKHSDNILCMVPTPTGSGTKSYDHSMLSKVLTEMNNRKVSNKRIIVSCTVLPGYMNQVGRFLIRDCPNTTISYNPEFIAQGEIMRGLVNPDIVLIGENTTADGDWLTELYRNICQNEPKICRMSVESAEICKLSINCFITTKISFANMVGDIASNTPNANAQDILRAVSFDSRIGTKCLAPGYGFGGPCFPRDNRALGVYSQSVGVEPLIPRSTDDFNRFHAQFLAEKMLKENREVYIFEDVCFKPKSPVPIIEESQVLEVAHIVRAAGKKVLIRDRKSVINNIMLEFGNSFEYEIIS